MSLRLKFRDFFEKNRKIRWESPGSGDTLRPSSGRRWHPFQSSTSNGHCLLVWQWRGCHSALIWAEEKINIAHEWTYWYQSCVRNRYFSDINRILRVPGAPPTHPQIRAADWRHFQFSDDRCVWIKCDWYNASEAYIRGIFHMVHIFIGGDNVQRLQRFRWLGAVQN